MSDPRVTVVVPNRDGAEMIGEVLDALGEQTFSSMRVVVADDGSTDESLRICREHPLAPDVVEVRDGPRGFGAAANAGIGHSSGSEYVALLNNDAVPAPDWLEALVRALDRRPGFAYAASRIRFLYTPGLLDSAGDGVAACGQPYRRGHRTPDGAAWDHPAEVLSAAAAAALYRRELLLELGSFDEDFFAVYEDVDLGWRAYSRGYRGLYVPGARALHRGSATLGQGDRAYYLDQRNREWLLFKNMNLGTWLKASPWWLLLQAYAALRALRMGRLRLWLRAKWDALRGLPRWFRKRQRELLERRVETRWLEAALDWDWAWEHARSVLTGRQPPDAFEFGAVLSEDPRPSPEEAASGR